MKLIKLELENFRQYKGKQEIVFANGDKNVTTILGDNGNGKTGIFRAIQFCLFDTLVLEKDYEKEDAVVNIHLVNLNLLQEHKGKPQKASVSLTFESKDSVYTITRSTYDMMDQYGKIKSNLEKELTLTKNTNGECKKYYNQVEIESILNQIANTKVKDLFFFDGDKIESLSTSNPQSREEIKNGVLKLLQIDQLEKMIKVTAKLKQEAYATINRNASIQLERKLRERERCLVDLQMSMQKIEELSNEQMHVNAKIDEILTTQKANEGIVAIIEEIESNNIQINAHKQTIQLLKEQLQEVINDQAHKLLMQRATRELYVNVVTVEKQQGYQPGLTIDLLDDILENQVCVCGDMVLEHSKKYDVIKNIRARYTSLHLVDFLRDLKNNLKSNLEDQDETKRYTKLKLLQLSHLRHEVEELSLKNEQLEQVRNDIANNQLTLKQSEALLEDYRLQLANGLEQLSIAKHEKQRFENDLVVLEQQIEPLQQQDERLAQLSKKYTIYTKMHASFELVKNKYTRDMRSALSSETTNFFKLLIAKKDKELIAQIEVDENYALQAYGWDGISIFKDISSGQKQMLSLSFVAALASIANPKEQSRIDMPLFMDTPFGKLDGTNRDQLIKIMPYLCNQWILLVTDTEFTSKEAKQMLENNKWNTMYKLNKISDGITNIEKVQVHPTIEEMEWLRS